MNLVKNHFEAGIGAEAILRNFKSIDLRSAERTKKLRLSKKQNLKLTEERSIKRLKT